MKIWIDEKPGHCSECIINYWCDLHCTTSEQCLFNTLEFRGKLRYSNDEMFIPVKDWEHLKTGDWVKINVTDEEERVRTCTGIIVNDKIYTEYLDYYYLFSDSNVSINRAISSHYSCFIPQSLTEAENCFDQKSVYGNYHIEFLASC